MLILSAAICDKCPCRDFSCHKKAILQCRCRECALPAAARRATGLLMLLTTIHCFCLCQSSPRNIYLFFAAGRAQPYVDGVVYLYARRLYSAFALVKDYREVFNKIRRRLRKPNLTLTALCTKNVPTLNKTGERRRIFKRPRKALCKRKKFFFCTSQKAKNATQLLETRPKMCTKSAYVFKNTLQFFVGSSRRDRRREKGRKKRRCLRRIFCYCLLPNRSTISCKSCSCVLGAFFLASSSARRAASASSALFASSRAAIS